jgi:hypothetical protein
VTDTLTRAEQDRVGSVAERAVQLFPWYGPMLRASGGPPLLREDDLAPTYYAAHDGTVVPGESIYVTSGTSTGRRKRVRWSASDHQRYVAARVRLFRSLVGDSCLTAAADLGTGHAAASATEIFAALGLEGSDIEVEWPLERHVELLRERRPDLLYTMPMILERLVGAGGLDQPPKWIVVLGDMAPPAWRAAMEARLGMSAGHIVDVFGSIEVGAIACSDERVGGYLFHEHILPEASEPAEPRADGGRLLVLTSLQRDAFPAVRYASGDLVLGLHSVVLDGQRRWAYTAHLGRHGSQIKHGELLTLHAMAEAIAGVAPGVAWTVRRSGLEVVIEVDERAYREPLALRIRAAVREAHPSVDKMIRSGLIGDLVVLPRAFPPSATKRTVS